MISVSICTYHTSTDELDRCIASLRAPEVGRITLVDNGQEERLKAYAESRGLGYIALPNPGFGTAHNAVLMHTDEPYHLVLNADVYFKPEVLTHAIGIMERNPEIVQMQPRVIYPDGTPQYCSRRLPSPFIMFGRRFARPLIGPANRHYLLCDEPLDKPLSVPFHTGYFLLLRTNVA